MHRPTTSISRSSHLRVVAAGKAPGLTAAIFSARVSATEVFGNPGDIASDAEDLRVPRLDGFAFLLRRRRVVLQGLDVFQRRATSLLDGLRMHRAEAADVDD